MNPTINESKFHTYVAMINNSVGANTWRHGYATVDGSEKDIMKNGEVSCAFFVSSILRIFSLIDDFHATVKSTLADMERNGWQKVDAPEVGDVLLWGPRPNGIGNAHLGFYVGEDKAVSNNFITTQPEVGGAPAVHHWLYEGHPDGERPLIAIYRGKQLFLS